jgi:archaellin
MEQTIYDAHEGTFEKYLMGRRIVDIEDQTITLDNGTQLELENTHDCCAWFNGEITNLALNIEENIITDVTRTDDTNKDNEAYTIHVLSQSDKLLDIEITGTSTSGYYCHSINLNVKTVDHFSF